MALDAFELGSSSISITSGQVSITKDNWEDASGQASALNKIVIEKIS